MSGAQARARAGVEPDYLLASLAKATALLLLGEAVVVSLARTFALLLLLRLTETVLHERVTATVSVCRLYGSER